MDTMLLRIFQRQVELQCRAILLAVYELNASMTTSDVTRAWIAIQNLLTAAANISKALWGAGHRFSEQRGPLRASLEVDDNSPLKPVVVRNHFEHFDEKLDDWWRQSAQHNYVDMNIGPEGMVPGAAEIDMFRQFDPATAEVMFWSKRFNLDLVVAEVQRMLPIAAAEARKPHWDDPLSSEGGGQPQRPS